MMAAKAILLAGPPGAKTSDMTAEPISITMLNVLSRFACGILLPPPPLPVGEVHVALPVVGRQAVLARPEVVADFASV